MGMEKGSGLNFGPYDYSGGGGNPQPPTPQGEYFVKVIDYDGTVLDEQWLDDGAEYTLPANPDRTDKGLVFQEWSSSETITNGKITIDKNNVMVGAIYTTASGQNEFDIELNANTGLTVTLNIDGDKDWGDGSAVDNLTTHTYSQTGKYTIKTDGTTITSSSSSGIFGQKEGSSYINNYCVAVRLATVTNIQSYSFINCCAIKHISCSKSLQYISSYCFYLCRNLKAFVIPSTIDYYGGIGYMNGYCFRACSALEYVVIPNTIYQFNSYPYGMFQECYSLKYLAVPKISTGNATQLWQNCIGLEQIVIAFHTVQNDMFKECYSLKKVKFTTQVQGTIRTTSFSNCYNVLEYDFSDVTSIPTLSATDAFKNINFYCKIKVPASLYDSWIVASNWTIYADHIVAV